MSLFAQVIVDILNQDVDRIFTYSVSEQTPNVSVGMRVAVPFGRQKNVEGIVVSLSEETDVPWDKLKPIYSCLDETPVITQEQIALAHWIKKEYHATMADALRLFVPSTLRSGRVKTKYISMVRLSAGQDAEMLLSSVKAQSKAYRIISALSEYGEMEKTRLNQIVSQCYEPLKKLTAQGITEEFSEEAKRSPYLDISPERTPWLELNLRQKQVLEEILSSQGEYKPFLLHGVTGSGKTEVYMQAINAVVQSGKTAVVLVPEISLTPQMVLNFRKKLGDSIAILHSALGAGERYDEWRRILSGEAKIVIGARSAIFAPVQNIGIIIVDEEHENSYISETHPRYDAVAVALKRGEYNSCPVILGSATPSVTRYYQMKQGAFTLLEMPKRANGKEMPPVEVVDMTEEFSKGNRSIFSQNLYLSMCDSVSRGQQIMLFLNRRGYSSFVMCRACGETITCENCDVSLTYHSSVNKLRCHYCGYEIPMPKVCPNCSSKFIKQFGAGTQKVEEEFNKLFPEIKTVRMDVDTTRGKDAHYHLLKQLSDGSAQALIGTQMIAKGHDFPKVSLVGVVAADGMLRMPDYRSRERTFALLTQVSGRAGRAQISGKVVLQTYSPQHFVIECAAKHDYKGFYEKEIAEREAMWYPPFAKIVRVLYVCEDAQKAFDASIQAYDRIKSILEGEKETVLYLQRSAAPISRLQEMYRHQVLIKLKENQRTNEIVNEIFDAIGGIANKDLYCDIQINPVNLF
ncbi:MAG: primosomal protein N' [Clostridia bacterium]|nr:primosomal protein N' [Clostridia bacterium]